VRIRLCFQCPLVEGGRGGKEMRKKRGRNRAALCRSTAPCPKRNEKEKRKKTSEKKKKRKQKEGRGKERKKFTPRLLISLAGLSGMRRKNEEPY